MKKLKDYVVSTNFFQPTTNFFNLTYLNSKTGPPPHSSLAVTFNLEYERNGSRSFFFFFFLVSAHEYYKKDAYRQVKDKFIDISHSQLRPQSFQFTPPVYLPTPNYEGWITAGFFFLPDSFTAI